MCHHELDTGSLPIGFTSSIGSLCEAKSSYTLPGGCFACRGGWLAKTKQRNTSVTGLSESDAENVSCRGPVSRVPKRAVSGLTVSQVPKRAVYLPPLVSSLSVSGDNRLFPACSVIFRREFHLCLAVGSSMPNTGFVAACSRYCSASTTASSLTKAVSLKSPT